MTVLVRKIGCQFGCRATCHGQPDHQHVSREGFHASSEFQMHSAGHALVILGQSDYFNKTTLAVFERWMFSLTMLRNRLTAQRLDRERCEILIEIRANVNYGDMSGQRIPKCSLLSWPMDSTVPRRSF